jgi:hypothetical protein
MPNDIPVHDTAASRRVHDWQPGQLLAPTGSVVHERRGQWSALETASLALPMERTALS